MVTTYNYQCVKCGTNVKNFEALTLHNEAFHGGTELGEVVAIRLVEITEMVEEEVEKRVNGLLPLSVELKEALEAIKHIDELHANCKTEIQTVKNVIDGQSRILKILQEKEINYSIRRESQLKVMRDIFEKFKEY